MANVFISHRGADTALAERLAAAIEAAGHHVWLDSREIGIGDLIVERINHGLAGSNYVVLCYSSAPGGVETPWIGQEWMSALARQLEGQPIKLLPVFLSGGTPPPFLDGTKAADLVKDWNAGLAELLRAIR